MHQHERAREEVPLKELDQELDRLEDYLPDRGYNGCGTVRAECRTFDWYVDVR